MLGQPTGGVHRLIHLYINSFPFTPFVLSTRGALPHKPVGRSISHGNSFLCKSLTSCPLHRSRAFMTHGCKSFYDSWMQDCAHQHSCIMLCVLIRYIMSVDL